MKINTVTKELYSKKTMAIEKETQKDLTIQKIDIISISLM